MSGFVAVAVVLATYNSRFKVSKCNGEVGGDGEGDLLLEWYLDLDLLAIHGSEALLLAPNMLKPQKSGLQQGGYPPGPDLGWWLLFHLV